MEDWKFKQNVKHRLRRSQRHMGFILVKLLNFVQPNFERTPHYEFLFSPLEQFLESCIL